MEHKLTAIIPCKDERMNIRPCIESLRSIADEILIADSGSTDGTMDIARSTGDVRIIEREYITSGDFKNWAIPQATHPWILLVDADERITPELAAEIQSQLGSSQLSSSQPGSLQQSDGPTQDGFYIYRDNHFMGHRVRYGSWRNDKVLRFFRRDLGRYEGPSDHGEVAIRSGRVGFLEGRLTHYTCWSWEQYVRKMQRYASLQAEQWYESGKRASAIRLFTRGPARFARDYFLKGGMLDGLPGLQIALSESYYAFLKQANLWQMCNAIQQPDPESRSTKSVSAKGVPQPKNEAA